MVSIGGCGPLDRGFKSHPGPLYLGSNHRALNGPGPIIAQSPHAPEVPQGRPPRGVGGSVGEDAATPRAGRLVELARGVCSVRPARAHALVPLPDFLERLLPVSALTPMLLATTAFTVVSRDESFSLSSLVSDSSSDKRLSDPSTSSCSVRAPSGGTLRTSVMIQNRSALIGLRQIRRTKVVRRLQNGKRVRFLFLRTTRRFYSADFSVYAVEA